MNIYSKEQIERELTKSMEERHAISSGVQRLVLTLSATMLTLLLPIGYVLELSVPGRICLLAGVSLLLSCLLSGMAASIYLVRLASVRTMRLSDYNDNYKEYGLLLSEGEQQRQLRVGRGAVLPFLATFSAICFVLALITLFALLCLILFL